VGEGNQAILYMTKPLQVVHCFVEALRQESNDPLGKYRPLVHQFPKVVKEIRQFCRHTRGMETVRPLRFPITLPEQEQLPAASPWRSPS